MDLMLIQAVQLTKIGDKDVDNYQHGKFRYFYIALWPKQRSYKGAPVLCLSGNRTLKKPGYIATDNPFIVPADWLKKYDESKSASFFHLERRSFNVVAGRTGALPMRLRDTEMEVSKGTPTKQLNENDDTDYHALGQSVKITSSQAEALDTLPASVTVSPEVQRDASTRQGNLDVTNTQAPTMLLSAITPDAKPMDILQTADLPPDGNLLSLYLAGIEWVTVFGICICYASLFFLKILVVLAKDVCCFAFGKTIKALHWTLQRLRVALQEVRAAD